MVPYTCMAPYYSRKLQWNCSVDEFASFFFFKPSKKKHVTSSMNGVVACSHRCSAKSLIIKFPFFFLSKVFAFQNIFGASKILLSLSLSCCLLFLRQLQCFFSFTNGRDASAMFHSPNASEYYSKRCRLLRC